MATATVRYSIWVTVDRRGEDDLNGEQLEAVRLALRKVPGFIDSSFEDCYWDD